MDLDSGYLFGLSLSPTRDGDAWAELLPRGSGAGAWAVGGGQGCGTGIAAGVAEVFPMPSSATTAFTCSTR